MTSIRQWLGLVVLIASPLSVAAAKDDPPSIPAGPFRTVHLMNVAPEQEGPLAAAIADLNAELRADHCPACSYRLFKLYVGNSDKPNYMITADWPGGTDYVRIHSSAGFAQVNARDPILATFSGAEYYGRFVEMK